MRVHISFPTRDLAASEAFYTALFGGGPDKKRDNYLRFQPEGVPIVLALMPGEPTPAADHYGLRFKDVQETKAAWERASEAGLEPRTELGVSCCWAVQNKAWVSDPDGRSWEIYTVIDDAPAVERTDQGVCCA